VLYVHTTTNKPQAIESVAARLKELLEIVMQEEVQLEVVETTHLPYSGTGKRRPIRRRFGQKWG
jgi:hypothetical protein